MAGRGNSGSHGKAESDHVLVARGASLSRCSARLIRDPTLNQRGKMMNHTEVAAEALARAQGGMPNHNYVSIIQGFMARGIAAADIEPRVNVFTYHAWRAKGRQVRKGEKGIRVVTFIPTTDKATGETTGKRPWSATVFHVTQTDVAP